MGGIKVVFEDISSARSDGHSCRSQWIFAPRHAKEPLVDAHSKVLL